MIETIIVPTKVEESTAGGNPCLAITYSDKGKEYTKRIFEPSWYDLFAPNKPTKIQLAKQGNYWNIVGAESIQDKIPVKPQSLKKPIERESGQALPPEHKEKPILSRDSQIEKAVWIKELGECIRAGIINEDTPSGKAYYSAYYAEMSRVLGIKTGGVTAKSRLVEEAMKMGKETEEGG